MQSIIDNIDNNELDTAKDSLNQLLDVVTALHEDAPFGSGMDLIRMAVQRKFISAEEYMNYAKELKAAGEEVANGPHYADWPDGEGFGSSDGNFAIKQMMDTAGYEFDEQDRTGRFVVIKMPEKLAKLGITNARMRKEPVAQESQPIEPTASQMSDEELAILLGSNPEKKGFDVAVEWVRTHREEAEEMGNEVNIGHADIGEDEEINKEAKFNNSGSLFILYFSKR